MADVLDASEIQQGQSLGSVNNPEPLNLGAGWGFSFPTHVEEPPTTQAIPTSLSSKSNQTLSNVPGVSGSSKHSTPTQTVTYTMSTGREQGTSVGDLVRRCGLLPDFPPNNGLMTPPAVPGTSRTAPVSLPSQSPGKGRTNPVNLSPTQQSQ